MVLSQFRSENQLEQLKPVCLKHFGPRPVQYPVCSPNFGPCPLLLLSADKSNFVTTDYETDIRLQITKHTWKCNSRQSAMFVREMQV